MSANVGSVDRLIRALIGVVLIVLPLTNALPFFDTTIMRYGAIAVGIVMLGVAATRICPLYSILGIKTCRS